MLGTLVIPAGAVDAMASTSRVLISGITEHNICRRVIASTDTVRLVSCLKTDIPLIPCAPVTEHDGLTWPP